MQFGLITLNISATVYLIWLCPQVLLNFKRKNTDGLSFLMHLTLYLGSMSDLIYGFGTVLQWQYKMVTIVNFAALSLQHYQFSCYGLKSIKERYYYNLFNLALLPLIVVIFSIIYFKLLTRPYLDYFGMFTNTCWAIYLIPQIIKNYFNQTAYGVSRFFILLSLFLNMCDFTSAWLLGWDYPSKIGPAITFSGNLILLLQIYYYGKQAIRLADHRRWRTAVTS